MYTKLFLPSVERNLNIARVSYSVHFPRDYVTIIAGVQT